MATVQTASRSVDVQCGPIRAPLRIHDKVPNEVDIPDPDMDGKQCLFDVFSWNSLIALSHSEEGLFPGTPVWQGWPQSSDIFLPGGRDPGPWPGRREIPAACERSGLLDPQNLLDDQPIFRQFGKNRLEAVSQPFDSGPLVDVNGFYSRFMIAVNRDMYDEIREDSLYSREGQVGKTVNFSCGCDPDAGNTGDETCPDGGQQGAVMVKSAWRILVPEDDHGRFHTTKAWVVTPAMRGQEETCAIRTLGLVGFHIAHKTQSRPQWIWSTFEHIDNAPVQGESIPAGAQYSFYQPNCEGCNKANVPPPRPWDPHLEPVQDNRLKTQVKRVISITPDQQEVARTVNEKAHGLLEGTVWTHYELISTQWPVDPEISDENQRQTPSESNRWCRAIDPTDEDGRPAPEFLANTTLETFIQGKTPMVSSSCITCHRQATLAPGTRSKDGSQHSDPFADFTFLLERAQ